MVTYSIRDALRIPGLISLARLPLGIAFLRTRGRRPWALTLLVAAAASDMVDGWYARKFHEETPTGAVLDALMDKSFLFAVVSTLVENGTLSLRDALLLGTRDWCELPLAWRIVSRKQARATSRTANAAGKIATILQFATVVACLSGTSRKDLWLLATSMWGAAAAATYWAREEEAVIDTDQ